MMTGLRPHENAGDGRSPAHLLAAYDDVVYRSSRRPDRWRPSALPDPCGVAGDTARVTPARDGPGRGADDAVQAVLHTAPARTEGNTMKRILLLAAAQTFILTIPMATHAHADEHQPARAEPAPAHGPISIEPTLPWPLRGLLPV